MIKHTRKISAFSAIVTAVGVVLSASSISSVAWGQPSQENARILDAPNTQPTPEPSPSSAPIMSPTPQAEETPAPQPVPEKEMVPTPQPSATSEPELKQSEEPTPAPEYVQPTDNTPAALSSLSLQLVYPTGDPTSSPAPLTSEFVFDNSVPGVLTIRCSVSISPNTQENRDRVADYLRFTIEPIGTSHTSGDVTSIRWDNPWVFYPNATPERHSRYGKGVYDSSTGYFTATATFRGLPRNNGDFGQKNVKVQWMSEGGFQGDILGEDSTVIEVFFPREGTNHPGMSLNAVADDYGSAGGVAAARSPNWFYYWLQAIDDNQNNERSTSERYAGSASPGLQGQAPAVRFYQNDYSGRYARTLIYDNAMLSDGIHPGLPAGQNTTGIDTFRDKVVHERHHALQQSLHWTNRAFNYNRQPADDVSSRSWSFNIEVVGSNLTSSPNGRKFNHKAFDVDRDDALDVEDSNSGFSYGDIEYPAYAAERNVENELAHRDWAFPGKQHRNINNDSN